MSDEKIPLPERVVNYYQELSAVAADLNAVSDELGKSITEIDAALKRLNLGITTWVTFHGGDEDGGSGFWSRDIGYARIGGKWGISLRKTEGDYSDPDATQVEEWPFNDSPRSLRLQAIGKIPELLDKLTKDALKTARDLRAKLGEAQVVADAVKQASKRPQSSGPPAAPISTGRMRHDVVAALAESGNSSAAGLLANASWALDGASLRINVPGIGKKMLALTINAEAEKIIRSRLESLGAPTRFLVLAEDSTQDQRPGSKSEAK